MTGGKKLWQHCLNSFQGRWTGTNPTGYPLFSQLDDAGTIKQMSSCLIERRKLCKCSCVVIGRTGRRHSLYTPLGSTIQTHKYISEIKNVQYLNTVTCQCCFLQIISRLMSCSWSPVVVWSLGKYEKMDQTETVTMEVAMCKAFECLRGAFYIEDEVITRALKCTLVTSPNKCSNTDKQLYSHSHKGDVMTVSFTKVVSVHLHVSLNSPPVNL